jgi:hypothetical protein
VLRRGLTLGSAVGRSFPRAASVVDRGEAQAERDIVHRVLNLVAGEQLCGLRTSLPFLISSFSDPLIGSLYSEIACGYRFALLRHGSQQKGCHDCRSRFGTPQVVSRELANSGRFAVGKC